VPRSAKPQAFKEAVSWFRQRTPMRKEDWTLLQAQAQQKAFTVAGVTQLEVVADVQKELVRALTKGSSLEEFKKRVRAKLEEAWDGTVANPGARIENIMRTNVQMAYAQGRQQQMREPAVMRLRPYWRYVATLDNRTTPVCRQLHGTTLHATDPFWLSHTPPLHFQCRGTIQTLRAPDAERRGITDEPPQVPAQDGFGNAFPPPYQPDLSKVPENLARIYSEKLHGGR
jgi:SPP1 gp7 family putative phage head morphogenesis protein